VAFQCQQGSHHELIFFEVVLAQIGDMQTIQDNLSTYSAHLVASRIMLDITGREKEGASLVMVDEAGTGTDPMQGAALARAILECLLDNGARVVATTHSVQLKNWAQEDRRTDVAAMEYKHDRPTFKLVRNLVGESHAMETARRIDLPEKVVSRAEQLYDEDQRSLVTLQEEAEATEKQLLMQLQRAEEREMLAVAAEKRAKKMENALKDEESELEKAEAALTSRLNQLQSTLADENEALMDSYQTKLEDIIEELKRDAGEANGTFKIVGDTVQDLHLEYDKAKRDKQGAKTAPAKLTQADTLQIGDWVQVASQTQWYGFKGTVQQVTHLPQGVVRAKIKLLGSSKVLDIDKTELCKTSPPPRNEAAAHPASQASKPKPKARNYGKMVSDW